MPSHQRAGDREVSDHEVGNEEEVFDIVRHFRCMDLLCNQ